MAAQATRKQSAARKTKKSTPSPPQRRSSHTSATQRVREAESLAVDLPVVGRVQIPRPEELAYYVALAALAAAEIIEWPVALALAAGHALSERHHSRVLEELGEAVDDSRAAVEVGQTLEESGAAEELAEALAEPPL